MTYAVSSFTIHQHLLCLPAKLLIHTQNSTTSLLISGLSFFQMTPLHLTSKRAHVKIVEYLISKGADTGIKDKKGVSGDSADCSQ